MMQGIFTMIPYLIIGGVLCGWTMLALLGSERKRRLIQHENERRIEEMQQQSRVPGSAPAPPGLAARKPPDPHKSGR
jgi:hypothetical protein